MCRICWASRLSASRCRLSTRDTTRADYSLHSLNDLASCLQDLLGKQKQVDNEPLQADLQVTTSCLQVHGPHRQPTRQTPPAIPTHFCFAGSGRRSACIPRRSLDMQGLPGKQLTRPQPQSA